MNRTEENKLIEVASRWESMCDLLDGKEVSDFMLSFPEVRQLADLIQSSQQTIEADEQYVSVRNIAHKIEEYL